MIARNIPVVVLLFVVSGVFAQKLEKTYWVSTRPLVIYNTTDPLRSDLKQLKEMSLIWDYKVKEDGVFSFTEHMMYYATTQKPALIREVCKKYGISFARLYPTPFYRNATTLKKNYLAYRAAYDQNAIVVLHQEQRVHGSDTILQLVTAPLTSVAKGGYVEELHEAFLKRKKGRWVNLLDFTPEPPAPLVNEKLLPAGAEGLYGQVVAGGISRCYCEAPGMDSLWNWLIDHGLYPSTVGNSSIYKLTPSSATSPISFDELISPAKVEDFKKMDSYDMFKRAYLGGGILFIQDTTFEDYRVIWWMWREFTFGGKPSNKKAQLIPIQDTFFTVSKNGKRLFD